MKSSEPVPMPRSVRELLSPQWTAAGNLSERSATSKRIDEYMAKME